MNQALQRLAFEPFHQGFPFSLNYRSGQRYSCTPVVNNRSPPRPETRAFASTEHLTSFLPHPYAQYPSSRRHTFMQTRIGIRIFHFHFLYTPINQRRNSLLGGLASLNANAHAKWNALPLPCSTTHARKTPGLPPSRNIEIVTYM